MNTSQIHETITVQNSGKCKSQTKVYEWMEIFKGGRTSVDTLSMRLSTVACAEVKKQIDLRNPG